MSTVHFKLDGVLRRYKKTPAALVEASGLTKTTVYNIVNNKAKAVELETLGKLMAGLRSLTGERVTIGDILEEETPPDWRDEVLKDAKPFNWDEMMAKLPELSPEEKAEGEELIRFLDEQRKRDRLLDAERDKKLLALLEKEPREDSPA